MRLVPSRIVALILVLGLNALFAFAADKQEIGRDVSKLKFEPLKIANTVPSGKITSVIQGPNGFIWFGTRDGAHRFDGYEIRTYTNEKDNPRSLVNSIVLCFFVDREERIWIGTEKGLSRFIPKTDSFENYFLQKNDLNSNLANHVNAIVQLEDGGFYASSESGYIYRYNSDSDQFVRLNDRPLGIIKAMAPDGKGNIWVGANNQLHRFTPESGRIVSYYEPFVSGDPSVDNYIESIGYIDDATIWVATANSGGGVFDSKTGTLKTFSFDDTAESYAHLIYPDAAGNIWVGHSGGMSIYLADSDEVVKYTPEMPDGPLPPSGIHSLLLDKQGNVWVGTAYHGLFVSTNNKKFNGLTEYAGAEEYERVVVSSIMEDREGNLWVGRNSTGIDIFPADGSEMIQLRNDPGDPSSLDLNTVFSLYQDSKGRIWAGVYRGGLHRYIPETQSFEKFVHIAGDPNSLPGNDVRGIQEDERGNLWVLTHGRGIAYFEVDKGKFTNYRVEDGLIDDWGNSILYREDGNLFVGSQIGFSQLNTNTMVFTSFVHEAGVEGTLSDSVVNTIFEDSKGRLWIGTADGINLFHMDSGTFENWSLEEGLSNRVVNSIVEDGDGRLWLGTDNGLARFDPDTGKIDVYDERDGLTDNAFYPRTAIRRESGQLFFGMMDGVTYFDPDEIVDNKYVPTVWITDFKVNNKSLRVDPERVGHASLEQSILETDRIVLNYDQKVFSINFVALNYIQSSKNKYAYMLENFDRSWNYVGARREATYTNLNPGTYVFKIKASNNDGYWNEVPRELSIVVLPPYWGTLWFRIVAVLTIIALPSLFVFWKMRNDRMQKEKLEATVAKRTKDLSLTHQELEQAYSQLENNQSKIQEQYVELVKHRENLETMVSQRTKELETAKQKAERSDRLKSAFLANMSHEIRTPMNAIIGLLDILRIDDLSESEKEQYTDVIKQSSATLMTLIDDILDMSRIESGEATLQPQIINCDELCEELFALFSHVASSESKGAVVLKLKRNEEEGAAHPNRKDLLMPGFDPVRMKQILTNLLSNAIKFTDKGEVAFGYETNKEGRGTHIRFFVSDTGIGIPEKHLGRVFDRFHKIDAPNGRVYRGTGLGLTITKRLTEMMGGEISVRSKEGEGTVFFLDFQRQTGTGFGPNEYLGSEGGSMAAFQSEQTAGLLNGLRILLAEDETPNYLVMKRYFARTSCELVWAKDGAEAIDRFDRDTFDLVLLDLKMPAKDGYEVLSHIRSVDTQIPVLVQTAYVMEQDEDKAFSLGASGFLAKPFTQQMLFAEIENLLGPTRT